MSVRWDWNDLEHVQATIDMVKLLLEYKWNGSLALHKIAKEIIVMSVR